MSTLWGRGCAAAGPHMLESTLFRGGKETDNPRASPGTQFMISTGNPPHTHTHTHTHRDRHRNQHVCTKIPPHTLARACTRAKAGTPQPLCIASVGQMSAKRITRRTR
jgi:hypothetical protein